MNRLSGLPKEENFFHYSLLITYLINLTVSKYVYLLYITVKGAPYSLNARALLVRDGPAQEL